MLILADLIFKQNEAMWLAELNISAIYDQLMKLNFLSLIFLRPINSRPLGHVLKEAIWLVISPNMGQIGLRTLSAGIELRNLSVRTSKFVGTPLSHSLIYP